jgi:dienelactone hydrolase
LQPIDTSFSLGLIYMAYRVAQSRILPKVMVALAVSMTNLVFAQTANGSQAQNGAPASATQFDQWRKQIKMALFIPDPLPQLAPKNYGTFSPGDGVVAERVTYGTSYGMRVPAIIYRPAKKQAHLPGLVIVNGHSGDKTSWYAFYSGILYARAGAVVVTYDPIGEDERNSDRKSETGAHDTVVSGEQMPARMGGQMITDVMQAVSYLVSRSDVDPKRIGVAAYSMGSFHAAVAGAIDPRIHAVVLSGGGNINGPGDYWSSSSKVMCQGGPAKLLDSFLPDKGAVLYALNQRRGPTLIMNGTIDGIVTSVHSDEEFFEGLRARAEALTGTKAGIFETYWFPGAGHRPNFVTRAGAIWLYHQLHFPNLTEDLLNSFGEVHVIEWSAKTGAHVDQNFQKELSEGGLRALTTDVPNVTRQELQAVPIDEWRQHKDDYVWESWVVRAGAVTK